METQQRRSFCKAPAAVAFMEIMTDWDRYHERTMKDLREAHRGRSYWFRSLICVQISSDVLYSFHSGEKKKENVKIIITKENIDF